MDTKTSKINLVGFIIFALVLIVLLAMNVFSEPLTLNVIHTNDSSFVNMTFQNVSRVVNTTTTSNNNYEINIPVYERNITVNYTTKFSTSDVDLFSALILNSCSPINKTYNFNNTLLENSINSSMYDIYNSSLYPLFNVTITDAKTMLDLQARNKDLETKAVDYEKRISELTLESKNANENSTIYLILMIASIIGMFFSIYYDKLRVLTTQSKV